MQHQRQSRSRATRLCAAFLSVLLLFLPIFIPLQSFATESQPDVIRVGRFPYDEQLQRDNNGNYSGYGYDYLLEIARYTGWRYEFVDASWNDCLNMLEAGQIDLMGAVMRSPEREAHFDFSNTPMISGYGVLVTALENDLLPYEDFHAFDGLHVGGLKGNQQISNFSAYAQEHGFSPVMREYDTQSQLNDALARREIDAYLATNILHSNSLRVVAAFGENDSYFATTKGNTAVLGALNSAMQQIRLKDPYFNSKLNQKYYDLQASTVISFTHEELDFIKNCPPIPCVYIPAAPISYYDETSKSVQGIAVDVCQLLEARTGLSFQWVNSQSASEATALLRGGEALLLPAKYYDFTWAKENHALLTDPYLEGQMVMVTNGDTSGQEIVALYDQGSQSSLAADAISRGAKTQQYPTILDCVEAVLHGQANTTFINSTIASYLVNNPKYATLQTTPLSAISADVAMAVSGQADPLLVSVLNKGLHSISSTDLDQSILTQMKKGQASAMATFLYLHPVETLLLVGFSLLALILVLLTLLYIRRRNTFKMRKSLYTDTLTGYPNYQALDRDAVKLVGHNPLDYALVYLDIHRFKVINDTFGYDAGDQVLIAASNVLRAFVLPDERMARVHADTFVLLLKTTDRKTLEERLEALSTQLEHLPFENSDAIKPLFRGGVYPLPADFDDLDRACDRANFAKDSIARHFSNTFVFYDDVMHSQVLAEKELESSMTGALERGEFIPFYQPKVNAITEKVVGAEALVRWQHPEKGCLGSGEFLPFYEKNGFVVKIDLSIFEQVCSDLRSWIQTGFPVVPISVNFSRRHLQDSQLPQKLKNIADCYQIPTNLLEIEVTETEELESVEIAVDFVEALKAYGFSVSIDDYGTGYSSISFLQQLPLDVLKLDRNFIMNAMKSEKAKDIMRYLVMSMHKNGIHILCEGIETEEQRDFVIGLNCQMIQGFLYAVPMPKTSFETYLRENGTDLSNHLDFLPLVNFDEDNMGGADDFLSNAMPSWVISFLMQPDYPVHYISPNLLMGLGYGELEFQVMTGGLYTRLIHPKDLPSVLSCIEESGASPQNLLLQYRLRKKDGKSLWVRQINKRILTADGQEAMLGVCTDVTDMVALQNEKSRIIETVPGGVAELTLMEDEPIIQQANDRFYAVMGYPREELADLGNSLCKLFSMQNLPAARNALRELVQTDAPSYESTFQVKHKDNTLHWITLRATISATLPNRQATVIVLNTDEEMLSRQSTEITRAKLELALSLTGQAIFEYDVNTKVVYSHSGFDAYGIADSTVIDMPGAMMQNGFIYPEDLETIKNADYQIAAGQTHVSYEMRVRANQTQPDSPYIWVRVTLSTLFDKEGKPSRAVGVLENINQQKTFELAFTQEAQYRQAFTESSLMAYEFNLTRDTIQRIAGSRGFRLTELCQHLPHPDRYSELLGASVKYLVAEADREKFYHDQSLEYLMQLYRDGVTEIEVEYRRLTLDGQELWNAVLVYLVLDRLSGDVMGYAYHRDIHERKETEKGLLDQAARDPLTGVLNRSSAQQLIEEHLTRQRNSRRVQAFLMLDLDRFKAVNDTYGHQTGDHYLIKLSQALQKHVRCEDIVARMGGDEFAVLLKDLPDEKTAFVIADKLSASVTKIGRELDIDVQTGVSIGIAMTPRDGTDFESLYRHADEAMYSAKQKTDICVAAYGDL